ncbi:hypothetical protein [Euzebya rosea]|uniref:hypothetical protein n=1 Tax=Euzebya rosea TaxID=2052804 RepID=UPI000D3E2128|nr:hypothetical protein [Euzebya rosea]
MTAMRPEDHRRRAYHRGPAAHGGPAPHRGPANRRGLDDPAGCWAEDRGSVTAWLMVVPVLLLLLGGVSLDLWSAASVRARLAAVADDAAVAGATALDDGALRSGEVRLDPSVARQRALRAVDAHHDRTRVDTVVVDATEASIGVTVTGNADLHLLGMVGSDHIELQVTGHAAPDVRRRP